MNVGTKIQEIMDWQGVNQKELAERSGLASSTISDYVRGARVPTLTALEKIAGALDVSVATLVNGEDLPVDTLSITGEEEALLHGYRVLTGRERKAVNSVVDAFNERKK